jgi:hypothetical protein
LSGLAAIDAADIFRFTQQTNPLFNPHIAGLCLNLRAHSVSSGRTAEYKTGINAGFIHGADWHISGFVTASARPV